jgi:hypothetical protein
MALTAGQRIEYIREIATLLDKEEWADLDLILSQHGLSTSDYWNGGDGKRDYVVAMIQNDTDEKLSTLHSYLTEASGTGTSGSRVPGNSPFKSDRLRLFLSHLSAKRDLVGECGRVLGFYGVDAFVAHDSIEPSREWQSVIEAGLSDCDAMVAFFHSGFRESNWCDQEVGWVMGRSRPILALAFDTMPHGFVAKLQAVPCVNVVSSRLPHLIVDWAIEQQTLHPRLAASLTAALVDSSSWDRTRRLSDLMERVSGYTDDQLEAMEAAAATNSQIRECDIHGVSGPKWVANFVAQRRTPLPTTTTDAWPTDSTPF